MPAAIRHRPAKATASVRPRLRPEPVPGRSEGDGLPVASGLLVALGVSDLVALGELVGSGLLLEVAVALGFADGVMLADGSALGEGLAVGSGPVVVVGLGDGDGGPLNAPAALAWFTQSSSVVPSSR